MTKSANFENYGKLLGPLEQELMELLWRKGEASGREAHAQIASSRQVALTTVLTVLERLAKKGLVKKVKGESVFIFRPGYSRDEFAKAVSHDVFRGIMDISSAGICASFVDALADTDPGELERLSVLIESMTTFALLPVMLLAITAAWLAYALPGLLSYTGSIADACQSIFVRCVEIFSLGKLFIFWSGALLVLSGIVYASFRAAFDIVKTNRAIKRLPLSKRCAGFILINDDSLKAAFTHGLLKPAVYLSRGLLKSLSNEELKVVLLHELSHKKRKDPLRFLALGFLRNAFFYLPAIGRIVSFSRLRSEHAADDAAARTGGQVSLASAIQAGSEGFSRTRSIPF